MFFSGNAGRVVNKFISLSHFIHTNRYCTNTCCIINSDRGVHKLLRDETWDHYYCSTLFLWYACSLVALLFGANHSSSTTKKAAAYSNSSHMTIIKNLIDNQPTLTMVYITFVADRSCLISHSEENLLYFSLQLLYSTICCNLRCSCPSYTH